MQEITRRGPLYYFRGHDFFSEDFDDPEFNIVEVLKTSTAFLRENGTGYFFKRLTLVETALPFASYFRKQKGGSDRVQPELLLLPEYAVTMVSSNFKKAIKAGIKLESVFSNILYSLFGVLVLNQEKCNYQKISVKWKKWKILFTFFRSQLIMCEMFARKSTL